MMRITIDINNREIGKIAVVNTGEKNTEGTVYRIFDMSDNSTITEEKELGTVKHVRSEGAAVLTRKVMDEIETLP